ncbi:hypothetical protein EVAR_3044_1 [Eumeta japonica]|uniref:Uncharacterized protein n=1 Tax=Eumeta variegata TaxID=151549 RepID=A0A4C1STU2_EUMVA|nr:hypothetical protein EVAR_3044_1 [Eumeta japonica]
MLPQPEFLCEAAPDAVAPARLRLPPDARCITLANFESIRNVLTQEGNARGVRRGVNNWWAEGALTERRGPTST